MTLAVITSGCIGAAGTGESTTDGGDGPYVRLADRPCPEDSRLTYDDFGAPFLRDWCTGCHTAALTTPAARASAPVGIDFDDLDDVRAHLDRIWARAGDSNTTMPPAGGPGPDERALLGEWLACGAP